MGINTHYSSMTQEVMPKDLAYPITHSLFSLRISLPPPANPELPIAYLLVLSSGHPTKGLFQPRLIQSYNLFCVDRNKYNIIILSFSIVIIIFFSCKKIQVDPIQSTQFTCNLFKTTRFYPNPTQPDPFASI